MASIHIVWLGSKKSELYINKFPEELAHHELHLISHTHIMKILQAIRVMSVFMLYTYYYSHNPCMGLYRCVRMHGCIHIALVAMARNSQQTNLNPYSRPRKGERERHGRKVVCRKQSRMETYYTHKKTTNGTIYSLRIYVSGRLSTPWWNLAYRPVPYIRTLHKHNACRHRT